MGEMISIDELRKIKGIGNKTIKEVKDYLQIKKELERESNEILKIIPPKEINIPLNSVYCGESVEFMRKNIPDSSIDLVVTSPPYDDLREYNGFEFNYKDMLSELYRVTKIGGVVVWVVNDSTINGSESGTSFKQALYAKEVGFNLHDTMIYSKSKIVPTDFKCHRYYQGFEYMFIFSKGKPKNCNYIRVPSKHAGKNTISINRKEDGSLRDDRIEKQKGRVVGETKIKSNIWEYASKSVKGHPAPFPEQLVQDHILTWSNKGDIVFDPMCGSGTTCKMAKLNGRKFIGVDISEEYVEIAKNRIKNHRKDDDK